MNTKKGIGNREQGTGMFHKGITRGLLSAALCAVGLSAFAAEPEAVQLWEGGPYWATVNVGTSEVQEHPEYGGLYKFDGAAQAVTEVLGTEWRVPSDGELEMLAGNNSGDKVCSNVWTTCSGIKGRRFFGTTSGYEDKSIFLPAVGFNSGDVREGVGDQGHYWSSEAVDDNSAMDFTFDGYGARVDDYDRSLGFSVRAVKDPPPLMKVDKVRTATHWPWDGKIDVSCDLAGSGKVQLSAALTTNGVKVCDAKAANITGATEIDLDAVGGVTNDVKFVWNAKADCPADFNSTDAKVKVSVKKVVPPPAD